MIGRLFRRPTGESAPIRVEDPRQRALETGRARLIVTGTMFVLAFTVIAGRMVEVSLLKGQVAGDLRVGRAADAPPVRADIVDRNGVLLATGLPTVSLYARPREVLDPAAAAQQIVQVLPELSTNEVQARLTSQKSFVYLMRNLTPRQEYAVNALGIPGLNFENDAKRIYPQGALTAHAVGLADIDDKGIAGVEKSFDADLRGRTEPLRLSLDVRVQGVVHDELVKAIAKFHAIGGMGLVMNVDTGEILTMVSLPDFDPNDLTVDPTEMFNRATLGVYEMGSVFKLFTAAAALDSGAVTMNSSFDTSPIHIARFTIHDDEPMHRPLTVPEVLIYSSNIGAAHIAMQMGTAVQKDYLARFGQLKPEPLELPERGAPLVPTLWRDINTMTIAFGHGLAVTPLHVATGVSAIVNGGLLHPPTLLARSADDPIPSQRVIKPETSDEMRQIMRLVVTMGTGGKANVAGYDVGGKTGTAEKSGAGGYHKHANLASFVSVFPIDHPRYLVQVMLDEPKAIPETHGWATAGWNAVPTAGAIIAQIGPILGVPPETDTVDDQAKAQTASAQGPVDQGGVDRKVILAKVE